MAFVLFCFDGSYFVQRLCHINSYFVQGQIMSPQPKVGDILFLVRIPSASASASA